MSADELQCMESRVHERTPQKAKSAGLRSDSVYHLILPAPSVVVFACAGLLLGRSGAKTRDDLTGGSHRASSASVPL